MTTNLRLLNPIHQIVSQKIHPLNIDTDEKSYFETDSLLFEDERYSIETTIEVNLKTYPDGDKNVLSIKAHVYNVYDGYECEDAELTEKDKKYLEKYLSENLIINLQ